METQKIVDSLNKAEEIDNFILLFKQTDLGTLNFQEIKNRLTEVQDHFSDIDEEWLKSDLKIDFRGRESTIKETFSNFQRSLKGVKATLQDLYRKKIAEKSIWERIKIWGETL